MVTRIGWLIAFLACAVPVSAQPATPCVPNAASWTVTTNSVTLWVCASNGLSWVQLASAPAAWADITGKPAAVTSLSGTNTGDQDLSALAPKASPIFTGTVTLPASTALVTPVIGVATGTSLATTGDHTTSGGKIGYATGSGGTVTQATNKATGVTLNKACGAITMNGAALAAAAEVNFTVTDSVVAAGDVILANHASAGTFGAYAVFGGLAAAGSFRIMVGNMSAGSLSEAIVIGFCVIKGATS